MKTSIRRYGVYLLGTAVMIVIFMVVYWAVQLAGTGRGKTGDTAVVSPGSEDFSPNRVRKITIRKNGDSGECIEITPDGAVRIYETCGGEMTDAFRTNDSRAVHRLFVDISETRLSKTYVAGSYKVVVETDDGIYEYYVLPGDGQDDDSPGVDGLIDTIINDQPKSTPTPTTVSAVLPTPTLRVIPTGTVRPVPTSAAASPTPTADLGKEFTCDFSDTETGKRPYRVSNYVCSTEPVANP